MTNIPMPQQPLASPLAKRHKSLALLLLVTAVLISLSATGCRHMNPRHGLIFRGDWSLEINRIPWMASHNDCYQMPSAPCADPGCPPCGPDGCAVDPCCVANPCGGDSCGRPGCGHRGCRAGADGGLGAPPSDEPPCVDYGNHPRFHPVPTKPVFSPRGDVMGTMDGMNPVPCDPLGGRIPDSTLPEPEIIPSPKPAPPSAAPAAPVEPDSAEPRRLAKPEAQSAWIFTPPAGSDTELQLARQRSQAARAALR